MPYMGFEKENRVDVVCVIPSFLYGRH